MEELKKSIKEIVEQDIVKVVISNKKDKEEKYNKIVILLKENSKKKYYQIEKYIGFLIMIVMRMDIMKPLAVKLSV